MIDGLRSISIRHRLSDMEESKLITGSCLCGGVRFEIAEVAGPFELCHCNRCRKASGSAFFAGLGARTEGFRLLAGRELIRSYRAPILERPPVYRKSFCSRCGSPVPDPDPAATWFEIPAGLLDDDPGVHPDKHISVELRASWFEITDDLPQLTRTALAELRRAGLVDEQPEDGPPAAGPSGTRDGTP